MKETRTPEQIEEARQNAIVVCRASGWTHVERWIFTSPSGTRHDLSAADLGRLECIEKNGSFLSE